jgi:hypothetical protein
MDVGLMVGGLAGGWMLLRVWQWAARRFQPPDTIIDTLIRPPVFRYAAQDDDLRQASALRRARAEAIKRDARLIETMDDRGSRLRKVM